MKKDPEGDDHHHGKQTYVLTFGLPAKVAVLSQQGLKVPDHDDPLFQDIRTEFTLRFAKFFPGAHIRAIDSVSLAKEIMDRARANQAEFSDKTLIVSTCSDIVGLEKGMEIEINRIVDGSGKIVGIGPRPGYSQVSYQVSSLYERGMHRDTILVEDGTFTGSTLLYLLNSFGRHLKSVVVGIAFPEAIESLRKSFKGEIIIVEEMSDFIDWMPDHDFFPFVPNCGRVFGCMNGDPGGASPFTLDDFPWNGLSFSIPYIMPFISEEMMSKWTSIPQNECRSFSAYCLDRLVELFEKIERLNNRQIKVSDLIHTRPSVSYPLTIGQRPYDVSNSYVLDIIRGMRAKL